MNTIRAAASWYKHAGINIEKMGYPSLLVEDVIEAVVTDKLIQKECIGNGTCNFR